MSEKSNPTAITERVNNDHAVNVAGDNNVVVFRGVEDDSKKRIRNAIILLCTIIGTIIAVLTYYKNHLTTNNDTSAVIQVEESKAPTGYRIFAGANKVKLGEVFSITVTPEGAYESIVIYSESPSGECFEMIILYPEKSNKYQIETETGRWTIYAEIINDAGSYSAQNSDDYVYVDVTE